MLFVAIATEKIDKQTKIEKKKSRVHIKLSLTLLQLIETHIFAETF